MPPVSDDPLSGTPAAPPTQTPAAPATPTPQYVTSEQLAQHTEQLSQQLGAAIREAMAGLQPAPADPPANGTSGAGSDWPELFQNPKAAVDARVNEVALPTIREFARSQSELLLDHFRGEIDSEYGEGTWDKEFSPDLRPAVEAALKNNPLQAVSRAAIENTVNTLRGRPERFDRLHAAKAARKTTLSEADKAKEDATVERVKRELPGLTGGLRLSRDGEGQPTLDAEGKEFIQEFFKHTGQRIDERELLATMQGGNKLSEWRAAQQALKAKGGAK